MFKLFKNFFYVLLFLCVLSVKTVYAQGETLQFDAISQQLNSLEEKMKAGNFTLQSIETDLNFLYQVSGDLNSFKQTNEQEAKFVQKQLDALGEPPSDGTKELDVIAKKRTEFKNELAVLKSRIAEAQILQVKIDELNILIINSRNQKLLGNLVNKQAVLIEPQNFLAGIKAFISFAWDMAISPILWYKTLDSSSKTYVLTYLFPFIFILVGTFWAGLILRRLIMRNWGYRKDIENPRYGQKISAAIFVAIAYGVIPSLIIGGLLVWLIGMQIFTIGLFGIVINSFLYYLLYVILARAVARVTFAPYNEKWRLINVDTPKAVSLVHALYLSIILIGIVSLLEHIASTAQYPQNLINFLTAASCAVKAFVIILLVAKIFHEDDDKTEDTPEEENNTSDDDTTDDDTMSTHFKIIFITSFVCIVTFGIALFGYPELSEFILNRYIASAILLGIFIIFHKLISELVRRILLMSFWVKNFRMRRKLLAKVDFGLSLILTPLIALFFLFVLLNLWGMSGDLILHMVKKLLFGFNVGGVRISLLAIVLGIVVFFASLALVLALFNAGSSIPARIAMIAITTKSSTSVK